MLRAIMARLLGCDEDERRRRAEANIRFAAALAQPSPSPNPALRWNPELAPPPPALITISQSDAAFGPDLGDLERAMEAAGLDAAERRQVREAMR